MQILIYFTDVEMLDSMAVSGPEYVVEYIFFIIYFLHKLLFVLFVIWVSGRTNLCGQIAPMHSLANAMQ